MRALTAAAVLIAAPALAQSPPAEPPHAGFAGLQSPSLGSEELAPIEGTVEQVLLRLVAPALGRGATRAALGRDPETARSLLAAREAAASGTAALRSFEFAAARRELDRALQHHTAARAEWIVPVEVARLHEQRATLFYGLRKPDEMREELARAIPLQPVKVPDEKTFPPDAVAVYREEAARLLRQPPVVPDGVALGELARRAGVRTILAGDARVRDGALRLHLLLANPSGAVISDERVVASRDRLDEEVEAALRTLLAAGGVQIAVPIATPVAVSPAATPVPTALAVVTPAPRPVPPRALPTPAPARRRDEPKASNTKWYLLGGAAAVVLGGAILASTRGGDGSGGGNGPDDSGVDVVLDPPN